MQRQAVKDAAHAAKLDCKYTLNEPTAAAFHEGICRAKTMSQEYQIRRVLVVDVGGGTTDLTLLRCKHSEKDSEDEGELRDTLLFGAIRSTGRRLGGDHVTIALAHLMEQVPKERRPFS